MFVMKLLSCTALPVMRVGIIRKTLPGPSVTRLNYNVPETPQEAPLDYTAGPAEALVELFNFQDPRLACRATLNPETLNPKFSLQ